MRRLQPFRMFRRRCPLLALPDDPSLGWWRIRRDTRVGQLREQMAVPARGSGLDATVGELNAGGGWSFTGC